MPCVVDELWSFILCPRHSTFKFASTYLQQSVSFVADASKHFYFRHCLQNTVSSFPKEQVKEKEKGGGPGLSGTQAAVCYIVFMVLCLQRVLPKEEGGLLVSF